MKGATRVGGGSVSRPVPVAGRCSYHLTRFQRHGGYTWAASMRRRLPTDAQRPASRPPHLLHLPHGHAVPELADEQRGRQYNPAYRDCGQGSEWTRELLHERSMIWDRAAHLSLQRQCVSAADPELATMPRAWPASSWGPSPSFPLLKLAHYQHRVQTSSKKRCKARDARASCWPTCRPPPLPPRKAPWVAWLDTDAAQDATEITASRD